MRTISSIFLAALAITLLSSSCAIKEEITSYRVEAKCSTLADQSAGQCYLTIVKLFPSKDGEEGKPLVPKTLTKSGTMARVVLWSPDKTNYFSNLGNEISIADENVLNEMPDGGVVEVKVDGAAGKAAVRVVIKEKKKVVFKDVRVVDVVSSSPDISAKP